MRKSRTRKAQVGYVAVILFLVVAVLFVALAMSWREEILKTAERGREVVESAKEQLLLLWDGNTTLNIISQWGGYTHVFSILYILSNGSAQLTNLPPQHNITLGPYEARRITLGQYPATPPPPSNTKTVCVVTYLQHLFCNITIPEGQNSTTVILPGNPPTTAEFIYPNPVSIDNAIVVGVKSRLSGSYSYYSASFSARASDVATAILVGRLINTSRVNATQAPITIKAGKFYTWFRAYSRYGSLYVKPEGKAVKGLPVMQYASCGGGSFVISELRFTDTNGRVSLISCPHPYSTSERVACFGGVCFNPLWSGGEVVANLTISYAYVAGGHAWPDADGNIVTDLGNYTLPMYVGTVLWSVRHAENVPNTWGLGRWNVFSESYIVINASVSNETLVIQWLPAVSYEWIYYDDGVIRLRTTMYSPIVINYSDPVINHTAIIGPKPLLGTVRYGRLLKFYEDLEEDIWLLEDVEEIAVRYVGTINSTAYFVTIKALPMIKPPENGSTGQTTYSSRIKKFLNSKLNPSNWVRRAYCLYLEGESTPYPLACTAPQPVLTITTRIDPVKGPLIDYSGIYTINESVMWWGGTYEVIDNNGTYWLTTHTVPLNTNFSIKYLTLLNLTEDILNTTAVVTHEAFWNVKYINNPKPPPPPTPPVKPEPPEIKWWFSFTQEENKLTAEVMGIAKYGYIPKNASYKLKLTIYKLENNIWTKMSVIEDDFVRASADRVYAEVSSSTWSLTSPPYYYALAEVIDDKGEVVASAAAVNYRQLPPGAPPPPGPPPKYTPS